MFQVPEVFLDIFLLAWFVGPRNQSMYIKLKKQRVPIAKSNCPNPATNF